VAKRNLAELKIPAAPAFIPVAKRLAATLGGQPGLSPVDLDELVQLRQSLATMVSKSGASRAFNNQYVHKNASLRIGPLVHDTLHLLEAREKR